MASSRIDLPSKEEINRCGFFLAKLEREGLPRWFDQARYEHAVVVVSDYRATHAYPLVKVTMGLRSMVSTEGAAVVVSQRLKRQPRIIRKLARMNNSKLARLEDVGGCRAVLADPDEVERVLKRLERRWGGDVVRRRNYVDEPSKAGYRAQHLVVQRDERRIEVQLRTQLQHSWADAIERADARLRLTLKDGDGPAEMVEYFCAASLVHDAVERGHSPSSEVAERFQVARRAVVSGGYYSR